MGDTEQQDRPGPYQLFMLVLCVVAMVLVAADLALPLDRHAARVLRLADTALCVIFLVDFCVGLYRAPSKRAFMKWGWIDFLSAIPAVGPLRLGRVVRVFRILRILRGVRSSRVLWREWLIRRRESALLSVLLAAVVLGVSGSVAIIFFERGAADRNIVGAGDAIWWAFVTMTTVGYGDHYPVTTAGRLVAASLMIVGIGLFSALTGLMATWLVDPREDHHDQDLAAIRSELAALRVLLEQDRQERDQSVGR